MASGVRQYLCAARPHVGCREIWRRRVRSFATVTRHRNHPALMAERAEIAMAQQNWSEAIKLWQAVIGAYGENTCGRRLSPASPCLPPVGKTAAAETVIGEGLAQHRADAA